MNSKKVKSIIGEDTVIRIYKPFLFAMNGDVKKSILLTYLVEKNAENFGDKVPLTFSEIKEKLLIDLNDAVEYIISFCKKMWLHEYTMTEEGMEITLNLEKISRDVGGINGRR